MSVFVVLEIDFGHSSIQEVVDSIDKARLLQSYKESINKADWTKYIIEEWEVK